MRAPELNPEPGWRPLAVDLKQAARTFVSGEVDSERLRVCYFKDPDDAVVAKAWFGPLAEGPPGHAHGGSQASVLEEVLLVAAWSRGKQVVPAEVRVRFRAPLRLGTVVLVQPGFEVRDGEALFGRADLRATDGFVFSQVEARFARLDPNAYGAHGDAVLRLFGSLSRLF